MNRKQIDRKVWVQTQLACRRFSPPQPYSYGDSEFEELQATLRFEFRRQVEFQAREDLAGSRR